MIVIAVTIDELDPDRLIGLVLKLIAEEGVSTDVGVHLAGVDESVSNSCPLETQTGLGNPISLRPSKGVMIDNLTKILEYTPRNNSGDKLTVEDESDRLHLIAGDGLAIRALDLTEEDTHAILNKISKIVLGGNILIINEELDIEVTDLGDLLDISLAEVVGDRVNGVNHDTSSLGMSGRIADEGSIDVCNHLGVSADSVTLRSGHHVVQSSLEVLGPVLRDVVTLGSVDTELFLTLDGSGELDVDIDLLILAAVVPSDDLDRLASVLPELLSGESPLDDMGTLDRIDALVLDGADDRLLSKRRNHQAVIQGVEGLLRKVHRVVDLEVHVLDSSEQGVTASEVEDVLTVVLSIPSRDKFDLRIVRLLDEDLDVSDIDDVLAMHELHTDDRSTADGGGTGLIVGSREEDAFLSDAVIVDEVHLVGLRLARDEVLDNLILELKTKGLHLLFGHLLAFERCSVRKIARLNLNVVNVAVARLFVAVARLNVAIAATADRLEARPTKGAVMRNGDRIEVKTSGGVVHNGGVASGVSEVHTCVVIRGTLLPRSHISTSNSVAEVLVVAIVTVVTSVLAFIIAADTDGTPAVVLLIRLLKLGGLELLDNSVRISDPRRHDVVDNEGGIVGSVDLTLLGDLQREQGHVVVIISRGSGNASVIEIKGKFLGLRIIVDELSGHVEVLGKGPGPVLDILVDDVVGVGVIEVEIIVDVVGRLGRESLIHDVTILGRPGDHHVLSNSLLVDLVVLDVLLPSLFHSGN